MDLVCLYCYFCANIKKKKSSSWQEKRGFGKWTEGHFTGIVSEYLKVLPVIRWAWFSKSVEEIYIIVKYMNKGNLKWSRDFLSSLYLALVKLLQLSLLSYLHLIRVLMNWKTSKNSHELIKALKQIFSNDIQIILSPWIINRGKILLLIFTYVRTIVC